MRHTDWLLGKYSNNLIILYLLNDTVMRILISADTLPNSLESEYGVALEGLGCQLIRHYRTENRERQMSDVLFRIGRRLAAKWVYRQSNDDLLRLAREHQPDVVWLFKGNDIFPETIRKIRDMGLKIIVYNADHPFRFYSRGSGNTFMEQAVPEYDLYFTYSKTIASELTERYPALRTAVIPFGHSIDDQTYDLLYREEEVNRVCFVGTPDEQRATHIKQLSDAGVEVDVYGPGWNTLLSDLNGIKIYGIVLGMDMYKTLRRYRVQLNFLRPHNANSHNMRSFEAPACGAIMLAEETEEHLEFFRPGLEAYYFSNTTQLLDQIKFLVGLSADDANRIRERARNRSVMMPFSYRHRAAQALESVKELLGQ
jgi:hypothetical protein